MVVGCEWRKPRSTFVRPSTFSRSARTQDSSTQPPSPSSTVVAMYVATHATLASSASMRPAEIRDSNGFAAGERHSFPFSSAKLIV